MKESAINTRKLKIPCIVGTENATKVLKDGDLVEVDANIGIVRKLNVPENEPIVNIEEQNAKFINNMKHLYFE